MRYERGEATDEEGGVRDEGGGVSDEEIEVREQW